MKQYNKLINITHTDLDGIGCPIVLSCLLPMLKVETYFCDYGNVEDTLKTVLDKFDDNSELCSEYWSVFITDISFRKESKLADRIEKLNTKLGRDFVRLIDHHSTSSYLNKYSWAHSYEVDSNDEKRCGTQWTFDLLTKELSSSPDNPIKYNCLEEFVTLVNLWDTWRWKTDYPEDSPAVEASWLNTLFSMYGRQKFESEYIRKIRKGLSLFEMSEQVMIECKTREIEKDVVEKDKELFTTEFHYRTRRSQVDFIDNYLKSSHITDKDYLLSARYTKKFKIGVIYLNRNISDVGNRLAELHPELDFIMIISLPKTVSFRCVKDLPVPLGIIANYITGRGGGHPKSAGGVLSSKLKKTIFETILS